MDSRWDRKGTPGSQDCFLLICGYQNLGGYDKAGMLVTSWGNYLLHCCPDSVWCLGPGEVLAEQTQQLKAPADFPED